MLHKFKSHIISNTLFSEKDKLLLAFSGGIDSVVLADLLLKAGYDFDLAHCNFNLRGKESEGDEKFCTDFAKKNKLKIHIKQFDTKSYVKIKKLSVQMAARELRYHWFLELMKQHKYRYVLTAHHANDTIETVLINLTRGTGINGLTGIPAKQNHLIRPLLEFTKQELLTYSEKNKIKFRHDSSNDEVKYARNFLRHDVIPGLKKLNPSLEETFINNIKLFSQSARLINSLIADKRKALVIEENGQLKISIRGLLKEQEAELLLHEWLYPLGFTPSQTKQLCASLTHKLSGKQFFSESYKLLIDRDFIFVVPNKQEEEMDEFIIHKPSDFKKCSVKHQIGVSFKINSDSKTAQLNYSKLHFPLTLRKWKNGDKFCPLGMKGFKKVSDFLTGIKMPLFKKDKVMVLVNGNNDIIWLIEHRIDDRYKLNEKADKVLTLSVI